VVLCVPAVLGGATILGAFAWAHHSPSPVPFAAQGFVWLLASSPLLLLAGAISVCAAAALSPRLPGRRGIKYLLIGAATALWAIGWALLAKPGSIDLP